MSEDIKIKFIKSQDVETDLAKLIFYTELCSNYKPYESYWPIFNNMLKILKKMVQYYAEDSNLLRVTEAEILELKKLSNLVPFEAYYEPYYDKVDNFIDIIAYYSSCPINEEFDVRNIKIKGR